MSLGCAVNALFSQCPTVHPATSASQGCVCQVFPSGTDQLNGGFRSGIGLPGSDQVKGTDLVTYAMRPHGVCRGEQVGMVVSGESVNAGVNHNLIGHGQPLGEAFHQQRFIFWG